jgi:hypothetical protein
MICVSLKRGHALDAEQIATRRRRRRGEDKLPAVALAVQVFLQWLTGRSAHAFNIDRRRSAAQERREQARLLAH